MEGDLYVVIVYVMYVNVCYSAPCGNAENAEVDSNEGHLLEYCTQVHFLSICTLLEDYFYSGNLLL